jgi:hypothetical protein
MQFTNLHDGVADHDQTFKLINRGYNPDQRSAGQYFETTEEIYSYFLNVLPPMDFTRDAFSMCEFSVGTLTDCFVHFRGRFFCLCISRRSSQDFTDAVRDLHAHVGGAF